MPFEELSPNAEKLLQEILDHRLENNIPDPDYWQMRFSDLSFAEDERLRSLFAELEEYDIINTHWADGFPFHISVFDKGYSYFEAKAKYEKEKKKLSRREWYIAVISAIIGAAIGLIPTIIQSFS